MELQKREEFKKNLDREKRKNFVFLQVHRPHTIPFLVGLNTLKNEMREDETLQFVFLRTFL